MLFFNSFLSNINTVIPSPLEQFAIIPIIPIRIGFLDLSFTNQSMVFLILGLFFWLVLTSIASEKDGSWYLVPGPTQRIFELTYEIIFDIVTDNIKHKDAQQYFPLVFTVFLYIISLNLFGLIPFQFTVTSHLVVTFALSMSLFIGITIIAIRNHRLKFFGLFLPSGMGIGFAFLLTPIEIVSYFFRPISLSVRLFANLMAGHSLLKIIAGFSYIMMNKTGIIVVFSLFPLAILPILYALECAVAIIQAVVFAILISIYLNDALTGGH